MKTKVITAYRIRFIILVLIISGLIFGLLYTVQKTFASYVSETAVSINATTAVYVLNEGTMNFNIDLDRIVPSQTPYVYSFTVANYRNTKRSDVDIDYTLDILTTTNLPLQFELYRNETYDAPGATDILATNELVQDEDNTWYRHMNSMEEYRMYYASNTIDTYYLVVRFPYSYATTLIYGGLTDNIEITLDSKQVIE